MKSGTVIGIGVAVVTVMGAVAAYTLQNSYYERVSDVSEITIGAPEQALEAGPPAPKPEPFAAPSWFECWDPEQLDADLQAGRARAVIAEQSGEGDFATERVVVGYPDGRAFQWRRLQNQ